MISDWLPALLVLAVVYLVGGTHGVWLGITQEARINRWARNVPGRVHCAVLDAIEKENAK